LAGKFSDEIFSRFHSFARDNLTKGYPLIISGGCGLNCEWNTKWRESGLFEFVFVPPCPNDSGSAIGTAIDAQSFFTGNAKISWNVYTGDAFINDVSSISTDFSEYDLDLDQVAQHLSNGKIFAWIQGRCEIGPRALGNRSLLAAPFSVATTERLNEIKKREGYRPIAPMCLEEDAKALFDQDSPSPYMLYFSHVVDRSLAAVIHVDGSARVQTVSKNGNSMMYSLLSAFKKRTGYGVLCNTSLNFNGRGFINRMSDLIEYCCDRNLDGFVAMDKFYIRKAVE
jgi:hydroxymethyl cephem carbamoyltransferase